MREETFCMLMVAGTVLGYVFGIVTFGHAVNNKSFCDKPVAVISLAMPGVNIIAAGAYWSWELQRTEDVVCPSPPTWEEEREFWSNMQRKEETK